MTFQLLNEQGNKYVASHLQRFTFPAGEQAIRVYEDSHLEGNHLAVIRGTYAADYVALGIWSRAVRLGGGVPRAVIPYLPGARDDRHGGAGARAYAALINAAELEQVICIDPHSDYIVSQLNRLTVVSPAALIQQSLSRNIAMDGVIIPDEGAKHRAEEVAKLLQVPTYQATKKRDPDTGLLRDFQCEALADNRNYLVVDDICDGGGTFLGLAAVTNRRARLSLWVTHGVFSGNAKALRDKYKWIFATDSINPHDGSVADYVAPVLPYLIQHIK